jgi:DNA repair protein RadD
MSEIVLREDQEKAVSDLRAAFSDYQSVLLRAPCRFGKTVVSAYIAKGVVARGNKIIFACHRDSILNQTAKTMQRFKVKHGYIASGYAFNGLAKAFVASADTLRNRLHMLDGCSVLIVDECHLWSSRTRKLIIDAAKQAGAKIIGLSATPIRLDGKPLRDLFDHMVMGPSEAWLIERGYLAKYRAYAPERTEIKAKKKGGDYDREDVARERGKKEVIGNAVDAWVKYASGMRTVVYCANRKHARDVCEEYVARNIPAAYIDGETPKKEQMRILTALADGEILVLISVELLTTGLDLAAIVGRDVSIQCVQLLRDTMSLQLAIQMMMRCMTAQEGDAVILDHVNMIMNPDGTLNHGFPDDEREWTLDGKPERKIEGVAAVEAKQCMDCFGTYRGPRCHCGSVNVVRERVIEQREGELVEIQRKAQKKRELKSCRSVEEVAAFAVEHGHDVGWIYHRMKAIKKPVTYSRVMEAHACAKMRRE